MARGRGHHRHWEAPVMIAGGDALGFHYPPLPPGGSRQVLGTMPTDESITPPIPVWLPARHWHLWSTIWHGRQKQYKYPRSKELIPWDTVHDPMGDYQGHDEYYVKGCFGYDEKGEEIRYRPGLPRVHRWSGRGLVFSDPIVRSVSPPPPQTDFQFYKSTVPYTDEEIQDLKLARSLSRSKGTGLSSDFLKELLNIDISIEGEFKDKIASPSLSSTKPNLATIPGEIRNQIYSYLFSETSDYEILWCTRGKDLTYYKHRVPIDEKGHTIGWRHLARNNPLRDMYFERPVKNTTTTTSRRIEARRKYNPANRQDRDIQYQASGPTASLMVCRRIYEEAMPLFYQRHNFSFSSRSLLREFMGRLSPVAMAAIGRLYVAHDGQAWPLMKRDAVMVEKEYRFWIEDLKKVVACFTGLRQLTMLLQIRDPHVNNAERADWAMGLRRGLAGLKYLNHFLHFDLTIRLACDTSNVAWAQSHGNALQKERARDLQDLVCLVKEKIFEPVVVG